MKIIAIGGEPATGKTTLVRSLLAAYPGERTEFRDGLVRGYKFTPKDRPWLLVLGVYDGRDHFEGTDRLSMSVQPSVLKFLHGCDRDLTVLFEGDRLFNKSFLTSCVDLVGKDDVLVLSLFADNPTKKARHASRGDAQGEVFLKGRRTKTRNIMDPKDRPYHAFGVRHQDERDAESTLTALLDFIKFGDRVTESGWTIRDDVPSGVMIRLGFPVRHRSVQVTQDQAFRSLTELAEGPFEHLVRLFKEQHDLDFKVTDFNDLTRFHTQFAGETEQTAKAFRVTYLGEASQ